MAAAFSRLDYSYTAATTTPSVSITTPAAGTLLVCVLVCKYGTVLTHIRDQNGDDFTVVESANNGEQPIYVAYKVADGDETSVTATHDTSRNSMLAVAQYTGLDPTPYDNSNKDTSNSATVVNSFQLTTPVPASQPGLAIYAWATGRTDRWDSTDSVAVSGATRRDYTGGSFSYTESSSAIAGIIIADELYSATSAQTATVSAATTGSFMNGVTLLFKEATGGGGVSQELTGNSSTSAVGTLGVSAEANVIVTPTGVAGSSAVGTLGVTAEINASAELSGVAATSAVGTLTAEVGGGATVALSGVAGTATVGTLTAAGQINEFVDLLGNSATGAVGTLIVVTGLQVALSGNAATGAVGTLGATAEVNASATLTGVGSSGAVGTLEVTVPITVSVELTGAGATGELGSLTAVGAGQVWTEISPVSTIWTEIS